MSTTIQMSSKETEPNILIISRDLYELKYDEENNRINTEFYGVWEKSCEIPDFLGDWKELLSNTKPNFSLLSDLSKFRQPSEEIREILIESQKLALDKGLKKAGEIYKSAVMKTVAKVISIESGLDAKKEQFVAIENAEKWLNN
ncbi:MAG: hypothetical protein ACXACX_20000 [Candidatus Hodarchaeales archaeon]